MPVTRLELENFKSYAGLQLIGPFTEFTSIIGPNGSGKSNLMDAISFILGVQSRDLRSSQLKDLIFRPPSNSTNKNKNTAKSVRCSAALVYETDEGTEIRFSRSISPSGVGDYQVDGSSMSRAAYEKELASIGVLVKARNFLVFQGDVESLARKSPAELVELIETISGSADYKASYEAAVLEKEEAENSRLFTAKQKKSLEMERKQLKEQKDEAERFHSLLEQKGRISTDLYLWQLFHLDQDRLEREAVERELATELESATEVEGQASHALKLTKKAASEARRETAAADKQRVQQSAVCDRLDPSIVQTAEETKNLTKKLKMDESQLEKKQAEKTTHADKLAKLDQEIDEYTQTESDLVQAFNEEKSKLLESSAGSSGLVNLSPAQEEEYERVREAAAAAGAEPRRIVASLQRKLDSARAASATVASEYNEAQQSQTQIQRDIQELTDRKESMAKVR